jgi:bacteriocin-like protein
MKENKQMTEQELDQVTGGSAFVKLGDIKGSFTSSRRGIIHPNFNVGVADANPTPHPGKRVAGRYGVINPDSM